MRMRVTFASVPAHRTSLVCTSTLYVLTGPADRSPPVAPTCTVLKSEPSPTAEDLGDGTVRVTFPIGEMGAQGAEMRNDPQMAAMMRPMLEGHSFTIRVAGAEVVSSTGEISEDGTSASFSFDLVEILNPDVELPESFETVVRY